MTEKKNAENDDSQNKYLLEIKRVNVFKSKIIQQKYPGCHSNLSPFLLNGTTL